MNHAFIGRSLLLGLAAALIAAPAIADDVRVVTWNFHEGFTVEGVAPRRTTLAEVGSRLRPDVLILQEVVSADVVRAAAEAFGLTGYHIACSDFSQADEPDFGHFEVAVISKYPITQVVEYDATPDNDTAAGDPTELPILPEVKLGWKTPEDVAGLRGFLWVRIDALQLTVAAVHLKSSRGSDGEEDRANAEKREFVAAAVAESVAQDQRLFPKYTALVAGDFNVGHSDRKNGVDPARDAYDLSGLADGYDETHALLRDGLVGVRMRNLVAGQTESTFPAFRSTPIDNIYVLGPGAEQFDPATLENDTFGSDHRPVWATWHRPGPAVAVMPAPSTSQPSTTAPSTKPAAPSGDEPLPVVRPADVAAHLGKRCIVEFEVRNGSLINMGRMGFLNSQADFRSPQNFTAVLNEEALKAFAAAGVTDPPKHFQGKTIRVTGFVEKRREQLQIIVSDLRQIVEQK